MIYVSFSESRGITALRIFRLCFLIDLLKCWWTMLNPKRVETLTPSPRAKPWAYNRLLVNQRLTLSLMVCEAGECFKRVVSSLDAKRVSLRHRQETHQTDTRRAAHRDLVMWQHLNKACYNFLTPAPGHVYLLSKLYIQLNKILSKL